MSLPLEKLSDLTPRHTIDIERPWFSSEPNRQVALETLAEYFAENAPALTNAAVNDALAEDPEASRLAIGVNDGDGKLPAAQLPDEIDARVQVLSGTDAALATEVLALGELAAPTDGAWIRKGDGVTPGGALVGRPGPSSGDYFFSVQAPAASAGANNGGSGAVGAAGVISGGNAIRLVAGNGGANSAGTGSGAAGGGLSISPNGVFLLQAGNGGAANGGFNGGGAGSFNNAAIFRLVCGNGGAAGSGAVGGLAGGIGTVFGVIRVQSGNGGAGGSAGSGGTGGGISGIPISLVAGNGGSGSTSSGGNGGAGGTTGSITLNGGNGGNASGATPGGAGGASGTINVSGSNASGTTAGAAGGSITTTANGNRAGGSITTAAGASFAGGSIDLSNGGNTLTIQGTSGQFGHRVAVPANSAAAGLVGQWASDDNYIYFYGATGWRRVAGASF